MRSLLVERDLYAALSEHRGEAVVAWLGESVAECPACTEPIRRTDPYHGTKDGLAHLDCPQLSREPQAAPEPVSAAVAARARRSDWG